MPRVFHNQQNIAANHSLYQNELLNESHSTLKEIATNTKNINLNVDTVEVSVDALEVLQAQTNTTLASMLVDTDAIDSSCNTIEAQSVLTASRLNNIQNKISANVDGSGDTLGQINSNILTKNGEIETSLNSLISANHTDLVALESSLTSMEGKIDTLDVVQDNALIKLNEIATNTANINVNVGDVEVNTNDLEVLQASTNSKLDSILAKNGEIETSANTLIAANHTDLVALETSLTSMEGKQDSLISANHTDLVALEASLTSMEGKQDSLISANHTDLVALEASLTSMEGKQDDIKTLIGTTNSGLSSIDSGINDLDTLLGDIQTDNNNKSDHLSSDLDTLNGKIDTLTTRIKLANSDAHLAVSLEDIGGVATQTTLAAAEVHLGNIDTGVDVLEACVGSNKVNVNISSGNISGFATQTTLASILAKNTEIETTNNANQVLLGTIDSDTNAIKNAVEGTLSVGSHAVTNAGTFPVQSTIAAAIPAGTNRIGMVGLKANEAADGSGTERHVLVDAAGHLQVDVLSGGGSTDVSGVATHAKQDTIIGHLDGVEGKLDAIETTNNACQVLLGTIDADTNAIKTAVEILDNAISGNEMQVDIVTSALPSGAATQTTLASILAKNTEIETSMNSLISANHTDLVALEATLTEIAPRQATAGVYSNASLADDGVSSVIDTDDYRYMTICASQGSADLPLEIQYSINNSNWFKVRSKLLEFAAYEGGSWADIVLEHPMRYVRFVNTSGASITTLYLSYQLSN